MLLAAGSLVFVGIGAAPANRSNPAGSDAKAWFDAKSICLFRLGDGEMPQTAGELAAGLVAGWRQTIRLPDPADAVTVRGSMPSLASLLIDFSDGRLQTSAHKDRIKLTNRVEEDVQVARLEVRGQPLLMDRARINMSLTAGGAQLALERDRRGRPVMMLADAAAGSLSFDISRADAERLLLTRARAAASKYGISIDAIRLRVVPETPRSVSAFLHVSTRVGFVPAGMMFHAHVDVDDSMNATIRDLTVDGDEALGPLIVGLLRPALAPYNNQTRPLVSFPAGRLQLRDVNVRVDDSLHLTAAFGA